MKIFIVLICIAVALLQLSCTNPVGDERPIYFIPYSELYSVNSDGTNLHQLTSGKNFVHFADFIPNSNKIFFVQTGTSFDGTSVIIAPQVICTIDLQTGVIDTIIQANIYQNVTWVNESSEDIARSIVVSADGKKIYYAARLPGWTSERKDIFCVDIQTKQATNLTQTSIGSAIGHFGLSFDGSKIVLSQFEVGQQMKSLYLMDNSGLNKTLLSKSDTIEYYFPQLLNDNKHVVYVEQIKRKIYLQNIDSATVYPINNFDISVHFFTELSTTNNLLIRLGGANSPVSILNLNTLSVQNLNIQTPSYPFFNKKGNEVLVFRSNWVLSKLSVDDIFESTIVNLTGNLGTTHIPKASYSNDKVIFINKHSLQLRHGEIK